MSRGWTHLSGLALASALLLSPGCEERVEKSAAGMLASVPARRALQDQYLKELRRVARGCRGSLGRRVASCQAYRAFYRTHRPLFDNYKPGATADAARLRALMQAGQTLLRSSAEHEQSVGAVVLGRGLYAMAWARAPGRAPFRRALSDTYRRTGNGALRYLTLDILCDDGGTSDFHGDAALAELILRAAGTDPDARVRSEALTCIQYKVHRVRAPTAAELRRWFAMERSVRGNQQAIIEIAARLKRVRLVADLCARYKEQHGRPTSTCTAVLSALGVPR